MDFSGLKAPLVIVSAVLVLAVLLGGAALYERSSAQIPIEEILAGHSHVSAFSVGRDDVWVVDLTLGRVDDLRGAHGELREAIEDVLGGTDYRLKIGDSSDADLAHLWADLEIIVQQGASSGGFADMRDRLRTELETVEDVHLNVQVDEYNIFVSITRGEQYLYRVVPRTDYHLAREDSGE